MSKRRECKVLRTYTRAPWSKKQNEGKAKKQSHPLQLNKSSKSVKDMTTSFQPPLDLSF